MGWSNQKQIQAFARDLYHYIWKNHKFRSSELESYYADKVIASIEQKMKESRFSEDIGKAVLASQYLLRDICSQLFTWLQIDHIQSEALFTYSVYFVIYKWFSVRTNVFYKVVDAASIIAEAILFCDSKAKCLRDLSLAPVMFHYIFEAELAETFFEKGGWTQLEKEVSKNYSHLDLQLFMPPLTSFYGSLNFNISFFKLLTDSPVWYPVEFSRFYKLIGRHCCNWYHVFKFDEDPEFEKMGEELATTNDEKLRNRLSARMLLIHGILERPITGVYDNSKCSKSKIRFFFMGLQNSETSEIDSKQTVGGEDSKQTSKKKKKRKQKKSHKTDITDSSVTGN